PPRVVQTVGARDRGRLALVDAGAVAPVPGRGARGVRSIPRHDRLRLARVHAGGVVRRGARARAGRGGGLFGRRAGAYSRQNGGGRLTVMKRTFILIWLLAATACAGGHSTPASGGGADGSKLTIAVIPKGTTHVFWQSIRAGAEKAGAELGVTIVWRGPLREDDRDAQVS